MTGNAQLDARDKTRDHTRMYASEPYRSAVELQRLMLADARNPELKPITRAALARAFCELEEMKRKIAMRPLPKPVDVSKERKAKAPKADAKSFSEPEAKGIS